MAHQPVVVGYDGSQRSKDALVWAADYARLSSTPLELVTAWETPPTYGGQVRFEDVDFEQEAKDRLAAAASQLVPQDVAVNCRVVHGHPANVLVQVSREASLLVLGARGRGGFAELVLGSVSQYCSHHAKCPVVIMRNH